MSTPVLIEQELRGAKILLECKIEELAQLGEEKASAERKYSSELAKRILILRDKGMATTLIIEVAKGENSVADKRFELAIAESKYEACKESIRNIREEIGTLRSLLAQMRAEYLNT